MVWEDPDGIAAALIWGFVDDFLLHAPTYEKLCKALTAFMDLAVDCGFLCHPSKLEPPNQVVKYIGFIINTQQVPALSLPVGKRDKALAMCVPPELDDGPVGSCLGGGGRNLGVPCRSHPRSKG
jgi:hypothetical protein